MKEERLKRILADNCHIEDPQHWHVIKSMKEAVNEAITETLKELKQNSFICVSDCENDDLPAYRISLVKFKQIPEKLKVK